MSLDLYNSIQILSKITDGQFDKIVEASKQFKHADIHRINYQNRSFDIETKLSGVQWEFPMTEELLPLVKDLKYRTDSGVMGEYNNVLIVDKDKVIEDYTEVCHYNNDTEEYYWVREETRV